MKQTILSFVFIPFLIEQSAFDVFTVKAVKDNMPLFLYLLSVFVVKVMTKQLILFATRGLLTLETFYKLIPIYCNGNQNRFPPTVSARLPSIPDILLELHCTLQRFLY